MTLPFTFIIIITRNQKARYFGSQYLRVASIRHLLALKEQQVMKLETVFFLTNSICHKLGTQMYTLMMMMNDSILLIIELSDD